MKNILLVSLKVALATWKTKTESLEEAYWRATRITGMKNVAYKERPKELGLSDSEKSRLGAGDLITVYQYLSSSFREDRAVLFTRRSHEPQNASEVFFCLAIRKK